MTKQVYLCWLQACALLGCRHQSCACTCAPQLSPARPAVRAASQRLPHAPALPALHAAPWPACVSLPAQRPARLPPPTWGHTLSFAPEHHCVRCYCVQVTEICTHCIERGLMLVIHRYKWRQVNPVREWAQNKDKMPTHPTTLEEGPLPYAACFQQWYVPLCHAKLQRAAPLAHESLPCSRVSACGCFTMTGGS